MSRKASWQPGSGVPRDGRTPLRPENHLDPRTAPLARVSEDSSQHRCPPAGQERPGSRILPRGRCRRRWLSRTLPCRGAPELRRLQPLLAGRRRGRSRRGGAGAGRPAARQVWPRGGGTARGASDLRTTRDAEARAGCGEAAGKRARARGEPPGAWGAEGRGGSAARVGSGGALPHSHSRSPTSPGRARSSSAPGSRARRACVPGALAAGKSPRCPRTLSNSGCFGNFPGAPPVECPEVRRAVKTPQPRVRLFSVRTVGKGRRMVVSS